MSAQLSLILTSRPELRVERGGKLIDSLRLSNGSLAYRGRMERPSYEVDSRLINAPTWPWAVTGWTISTLHMLFFLAAWIRQAF
jgi:hypothetical protein